MKAGARTRISLPPINLWVTSQLDKDRAAADTETVLGHGVLWFGVFSVTLIHHGEGILKKKDCHCTCVGERWYRARCYRAREGWREIEWGGKRRESDQKTRTAKKSLKWLAEGGTWPWHGRINIPSKHLHISIYSHLNPSSVFEGKILAKSTWHTQLGSLTGKGGGCGMSCPSRT